MNDPSHQTVVLRIECLNAEIAALERDLKQRRAHRDRLQAALNWERRR